MEGVCAPAARACHADNVHILPVETPRTFGTLTTHYVFVGWWRVMGFDGVCVGSSWSVRGGSS